MAHGRYKCIQSCQFSGQTFEKGWIGDLPLSPTPPSSRFESCECDIESPQASAGRVDLDGTWYYPNPGWDDLRFPFMGQRLDTSSGRIDYNFDECTVDFATNARYDNEPVCFTVQFPHGMKVGSLIVPHLHWVQEEAAVPNWLIEYRWYGVGQLVPSTWTLATVERVIHAYASGALYQYSEFPAIVPPDSVGLSSQLDVRLFRDSDNDSGEFAGDDPYSVAAKAKEFDIHVLLDSQGSGDQFSK